MTAGAAVSIKHRVIAILWPSFALAAIATGVFFSTFDPQQLLPYDSPTSISRLAAYSVGFFAFWLFSALSIAVGIYFLLLNTESDAGTPAGHDDD